MMGIGVYSHTLLHPMMSLLLSCFLLSYSPTPTLLFLFICFTFLFLSSYSCSLPLLPSYYSMFIVLLSYSHAHASAVLLQFPIPQNLFNSLLSYSPLLILLLSCCPTLLLSCSLTFCLLSWFHTRTLLLLLFYSFAVTRILPALSLLFPLDYSSIPTLSQLFSYSYSSSYSSFPLPQGVGIEVGQ